MNDLTRATKADHLRIKNIMGDVFDDDPVNRWVFGDQLDVGLYYAHAAKVLFLEKGMCWIAEGELGAAMLLRPGIKKQISILKLLPLLGPIIRKGGIKALIRGIKVDEFLAKKAPKEQPFYYLFAIGARKSARGQGVGSQLMRACISEAEQHSMPIYLENSKEENLGFYHRHGFELIEKIEPGGTGCPPMWLMMRPAQGFD
jgi:ribosomal protein S18 acetylase RimI-like enzyme